MDLEWSKPLGRVTLALECLRRNVDGSELADRSVSLHLTGVRSVAIAHEPNGVGIRPSEYRRERWMTADDLVEWSAQPHEVFVAVNSPRNEEDVAMAHRVEWALGSHNTVVDSPIRLVVCLEGTSLLGRPTTDVMLLLAGQQLEVRSGGVPLDLKTWRNQHAAWWKQWKQHWDEKPESNEDEAPLLEDAFIPAGDDPPADLSYRPPREPPVDLDPNDLPDDLLKPISLWFRALHALDWHGRARATRDLDLPLDEQAERVRTNYEQVFGRWPYARQIDGWWIEDPLAEVSVRGVEHRMPDEEDPAENVETVWTFRLRSRDDGWVIRSHSQRWPPRSAPTKPAKDKPWLARWTTGEIKS